MATSSLAKADAPGPVAVRTKIVAFVTDDLSAAALRTGLEGADLEVKSGDIHSAIRYLQKDTDILAVIADISDVDNLNAALEDLATVCPRDVKVALIGQNTDIDFYRMLLDLGLNEYLPKPLTRDRIQTRLRPNLVEGATLDPADRGGHVISVCGAQGGAGATSIAINLALLLAETTKAKVALLDLHLQGGETAVMLGLPTGPQLRIALEDPERADTLFIERAAESVNERVKLIAANEPVDKKLHVTEAGVRHVLELLRGRFNFVVVDVPAMPLAPEFHPVIALSRHVLVLLESEITGLRNAHALRDAVIGIRGENKVFTVLNRANRPGGLPVQSVAKALEGPIDMQIPDLGRKMTDAVNSGEPALNKVPALRRHLSPIVREIVGIGDRKQRSSWIKRMLGR